MLCVVTHDLAWHCAESEGKGETFLIPNAVILVRRMKIVMVKEDGYLNPKIQWPLVST